MYTGYGNAFRTLKATSQWLLLSECGDFNFPISYQNIPYIGLATGHGYATSSVLISREIHITDNNSFTISSQTNSGASFILFIGN